MSLHRSFSGLLLAVAATATLGLSAPAPVLAQSYDFQLSYSEELLNAAGTDQEAMVKHYVSWDSPIARIRKRNMPFIEITNTSATATPLTQFQMTIGKPVYNFSDDVLLSYAKLGITTPDVAMTSSTPDGGDTLVVNFANGGLQPNQTVRFQVDIDVDPGHPELYAFPDYRMVFFEVNGTVATPTDNSVLTLTFGKPGGGTSTQSQTLPDFVQNGPIYVNGGPLRDYSNMDPAEMFELTGEIPEPGAGLLAMLSLAGFGGLRVSRRR